MIIYPVIELADLFYAQKPLRVFKSGLTIREYLTGVV
jgi:hypothetical protein